MPQQRLAPEQWFPAGWPGLTSRRVATANGFSFRVVEGGPPDGPPVVLLHGWAVSAYLWRHTITGLAAAGFRAIAPDLPGHGLSDAPDARGSYTLAAFADRIGGMMDAVGAPEAPVVAQSMGGRVAVALAMCGRATRLALFGPVGFGDVTPATAYAPFIPQVAGEWATQLVTRQLVETVQRRVHGKLGWFTDRDVDEYWAPTQFPAVVRASLQMLREFSWAPLTEEELRAIQVPALVVFGTADKTVKPARAQGAVASLPHGRLEWIEGGGHVVMEEVPERVNAMLVEFLRANG